MAEEHSSAEHQGAGIETLPDGSLSIPVLAEELVVEKKWVVSERLIVRKRIEIREEVVEEEVSFEQLEIEAPEGLLDGEAGPVLVRLVDAPKGAAAGEPTEPGSPAGRGLVRHEERLAVGTRIRDLGSVRARKRIETRRAQESVARAIEVLDDVERVPPNDDDSAQIETLPEGSVSIPVMEEQLVVTKRMVLRERVLIRKVEETDRYRIEETLRREEVSVDRSDLEASE